MAVLTVYLSKTLLFTGGEGIQIRPSMKYVQNYFIVEYWKIKERERKKERDGRKSGIKEKVKQRKKNVKSSRALKVCLPVTLPFVFYARCYFLACDVNYTSINPFHVLCNAFIYK